MAKMDSAPIMDEQTYECYTTEQTQDMFSIFYILSCNNKVISHF